MVSQKTKEKIFRLTPDQELRVNYLVQYAKKSGHITKASFQEFMLFAVQCADKVLEDYHTENSTTSRRRPVI